MNEKQIAFIICAYDALYYNECVKYINDINIPEGYVTDIICIQDADSIEEAYQAGMQASNARYKVYLQQNIFILNSNFITDMLHVFESDENIGMLGVSGICENVECSNDCNRRQVGQIYKYMARCCEKTGQKNQDNYVSVSAIDGMIIATQYDVSWLSDTANQQCDYNIAVSVAMQKKGYKVVVPYQKNVWCYHDVGCGNEEETLLEQLKILIMNGQYKQLQEIAEQLKELDVKNTQIQELVNLIEIYSLEEESVTKRKSIWFEYDSWEKIYDLYIWVKFVLLRIEFMKDDDRIDELKEYVKQGLISRDAIRIISNTSLENTKHVYSTLLQEQENEPLVSVVVSVYNGASFVKDTIESVLNQTYQNLELIIIDDASTDNSLEVIRSIKDSRMKVIPLEKNKHFCNAGNIGFEKAKGKYIAIIGHDDLWEEDKLQKQVSFMEEHEGYLACFTLVNVIDENKLVINDKRKDIYNNFNRGNMSYEKWNRKLLIEGNQLCASSACVRGDFIKKQGGYKYALVQLQDYEMWMRMLREGNFYILQERLTLYRWFNQEGVNLSSINLNTVNRDKHENQWIKVDYLKNISDDKFIRCFKELFKNSNAVTSKELMCEKAFLLWGMRVCFVINWFIELLEDKECREILEEKYQFELTDFYKMNTQSMQFDFGSN